MINDEPPTLESAIDIAQDSPHDPGWSAADVETLKTELAALRAARDRERQASRPLFSGEFSRELWAQIDSADTVGELRRALYAVCCRLQELELRLSQEEWIPYVERLGDREHLPDDTGQHYISGIPLARLEIRHEDEEVDDFELPAGRTIIGRSSSNDLTIPSKVISRHHAQIVTDLQQSLLEDLNSSNGVYVGSKRVRCHPLSDGDIITIGQHRILYRNLRANKLDPDLNEKDAADTA